MPDETTPPNRPARRAAWTRALSGAAAVVVVGGVAAGVLVARQRSATSAPAGPPATLPQAAGAAYAWDPGIGAVVRFGGALRGGDDTAQTWAWDGSAWRQLRPAQSPPARQDAALVWDPELHALLLFGGARTSSVACATAIGAPRVTAGPPQSANAMPATPRPTTGAGTNTEAPPPILAAPNPPGAMPPVAPGGGPVVCRDDSGLDDTWAFDGTTWTQLHPRTSPPAGTGWQLAWDEPHHVALLVARGPFAMPALGAPVRAGGGPAGAPGHVVPPLPMPPMPAPAAWTFDGGAWTAASASVTATAVTGTLVTTASGAVLVSSAPALGCPGLPYAGGAATGVWSCPMMPACDPGAAKCRSLPCGWAVTPPEASRCAVPATSVETWNGAGWSGTAAANAPQALTAVGATADGTLVGVAPDGATWTLGGTAWARHTGGEHPDAAPAGALVGAPGGGALLVTAGGEETWRWDGAGWSRVAGSAPPSPSAIAPLPPIGVTPAGGGGASGAATGAPPLTPGPPVTVSGGAVAP